LFGVTKNKYKKKYLNKIKYQGRRLKVNKTIFYLQNDMRDELVRDVSQATCTVYKAIHPTYTESQIEERKKGFPSKNSQNLFTTEKSYRDNTPNKTCKTLKIIYYTS
jgi:hypothetical protein